MKLLDKLLISEFVQQVRMSLAKEDESVLAVSDSASSWAWSNMAIPDSMDWPEFSAYSDAVGDELVVHGILKVDKRKKRGLPGHNLLRLRLSRKWYNENRKGGDK